VEGPLNISQTWWYACFIYQENAVVIHSIVGWKSSIGRWSRVQASFLLYFSWHDTSVICYFPNVLFFNQYPDNVTKAGIIFVWWCFSQYLWYHYNISVLFDVVLVPFFPLLQTFSESFSLSCPNLSDMIHLLVLITTTRVCSLISLLSL